MESPALRPLYPWFTFLSLAVAVLVAVGFLKDQFREWKEWQKAFVEVEISRATTDEERRSAASIPIEVRQVMLPELGRVDRCVTCHLTVDDPSYSGFSQPLAYHPNHEQHPVDRFGCTICHAGQGLATSREAAHGHVKHWDRPMLPMKYIEASCAKCHRPEDNPLAPRLARGHELVREWGCMGCHKLDGVGGNIGPELDGVGARRHPDWLIQHFRHPTAVSPGSAMPPIEATDEDLELLTLYMMGQTDDRLSDYHISMKTIPGPQTGRKVFEEKGCIGCHSIGGRGGDVGPALDDVGSRRDMAWLVEHFRDPQALSPRSVMPRFNFTDHEIKALSSFLLSLADTNIVGYLKLSSWMTPEERGESVYKKYGCAGCHGKGGEGGVPNRNAKTAEQVPSLLYVAEGYTTAELKQHILQGQREIVSLDPAGAPPPLYMPGWSGKIKTGELEDLTAYLISLLPEEEDLGF